MRPSPLKPGPGEFLVVVDVTEGRVVEGSAEEMMAELATDKVFRTVKGPMPRRQREKAAR